MYSRGKEPPKFKATFRTTKALDEKHKEERWQMPAKPSHSLSF